MQLQNILCNYSMYHDSTSKPNKHDMNKINFDMFTCMITSKYSCDIVVHVHVYTGSSQTKTIGRHHYFILFIDLTFTIISFFFLCNVIFILKGLHGCCT